MPTHPLLPVLGLIVAAPVVAFVAVLFIPGSQQKLIKRVSAVAGLFTLLLSGVVWLDYDTAAGGYQLYESYPWIPALDVRLTFAVDGASVVLVFLNAVVYLTGVLSMWQLETRVKEYFAFMNLLVVGVFGVFVSLDLFAFFFFYEVAVLPMYPLIAIWGSGDKEKAAMKLMLFLMAGSAALFPALVTLYFEAGLHSWDITVLQTANYSDDLQIFIYPFLYVGFGILAAMFPFHSWSPTGHVAAPTAVSMLHAGVLMKLGAFGILRVAMTLLPVGAAYWAPTFATLATVAVVYGAFVAMRQTDFKFVIGFSSVSHMGLVLLGLNTLTPNGINGAIFQMFAHGIMTALFFSSVGFIYEQTHDRDIRHFGGLVKQVPVAGTFFIIAGLCGMGVPGFASFWAELLVFIAAIEVYPILGIVSVAGLVITALYMLRVFGKAMFGESNVQWDHLRDVTAWLATPRAMLAAVLIFFGFFPWWILDLVNTTTLSLVVTGMR